LARVLIIGCGCRGRGLAGALAQRGHAVRGTTRDASSLEAIRAAGAEAVVADPDRVGTLVPALAGVAVACWALGSLDGDTPPAAELHGPRLRAFLEKVVDTGVRGVVYEAAGSVDAALLRAGAEEVERAAETWRIPVALLDAEPSDHEAWTAAAVACVEGLLG
jgi:uncharacterized protein YbjT (DUF2867 family)